MELELWETAGDELLLDGNTSSRNHSKAAIVELLSPHGQPSLLILQQVEGVEAEVTSNVVLTDTSEFTSLGGSRWVPALGDPDVLNDGDDEDQRSPEDGELVLDLLEVENSAVHLFLVEPEKRVPVLQKGANRIEFMSSQIQGFRLNDDG